MTVLQHIPAADRDWLKKTEVCLVLRKCIRLLMVKRDIGNQTGCGSTHQNVLGMLVVGRLTLMCFLEIFFLRPVGVWKYISLRCPRDNCPAKGKDVFLYQVLN